MVGVMKNHLKVLNKLRPKRIANAKTPRPKGAVNKGSREMLLDTKAIERYSEQQAHNSMNLVPRKGHGQQGVFNGLHDCGIEAIPCGFLGDFSKPEVFSPLCYYIAKVVNFIMHLPIRS